MLDPDGKNIEAVLRRRSQFTPEPARCRARLHRIDKLDHSLMNVFTSGALECSDVKAGRAGGDPCQHRHRFALRACWSVKRAHDVVPYIRREHKTLSHRVDAREGPVMGIVFHARAPTCWSIQTTSRKVLGGRMTASAECRHWSGRAVRWSIVNRRRSLMSLNFDDHRPAPVAGRKKRRPSAAQR